MRPTSTSVSNARERESHTSARSYEAPAHAAVTLDVIVVDDQEDARLGLAKTVELLGHTCRVAANGLEAWEMHNEKHADVILSDWQMPDMDGIELCRRTRAVDGDAQYTYFIFLTGFADRDHFLRGMEAGADDYQSKPVDIDELQARLVSAGRVIGLYRQLAERNARLRRDSQSSFRAARMDPLTGVANRLRMNEDLEVLWSRAKRYGHRYSIAICDIDEFKQYNDEFGHLAGDEVLHDVAQTVRATLRQGDGLYRYGGEEFVVVLPEQCLDEAKLAMERARSEVERRGITATVSGGVVTISIGIAELDPVADETLRGWLARADAALYRAKSDGRNRVRVSPPPTPVQRSRTKPA